jgi:hypothetical protein
MAGFFDWGRSLVNSLPIVGGITSSLWGDPAQEGVQDAYKKAQEEQEKQRAYMMQGRMNAMNQGALAFGPRNQMLGEMMGKGPGQNAMDLGPMLRNPMPQQQQNDIRTAAFGSTMSPQEQAIRGLGKYKGYQ